MKPAPPVSKKVFNIVWLLSSTKRSRELNTPNGQAVPEEKEVIDPVLAILRSWTLRSSNFAQDIADDQSNKRGSERLLSHETRDLFGLTLPRLSGSRQTVPGRRYRGLTHLTPLPGFA